jgi:glycosyltransferase involved in cell wall biosynthesis
MKISVVIPNYNHARWLPESIESALNQTLKPHEIIVVDDGSTDNTREVVAQYPVRYVYQKNAGLSATRNKGIAESTGDWIALLDADDYWLPQKLELQAAAIRDEEFCYCGTTQFFNDGHTENPEFHDGSRAKAILKHHNFIDPSSVLVRRDVLLQVGGFNVNLPAGEDWEMWLKLSPMCRFVGVPERLLMYRVTGTGMSANPEIFLRSMDAIVSAGTAHLPPFRRFIEARRMRCVRALQVAIKYREKRDYRRSLACALRAFGYWPSPFYDKTFRVVLVEIARQFGVARTQ